jgi:succinyl-CoA synthetase beta subunit
LRALLKPGPLDEAESKGLFAHFGIPVTREIVADTAEGAEAAAKTFDGKVVVKVLSRRVLHKSEVGGVAIGVLTDDVKLTCSEIEQRFIKATQHKPEGFLVQEFVSGGIELILGFHRDAQLGPMVLLGMGGVTAELYRDTSMRLAPVSRRDAKMMIEELKSAPLLKGYRGRALADAAALVDAIVAFSNMVVTVGDNLQEAEINPLFVMPQGRGVIAGDGVAIINSPIRAQ